MLSIAKHPAAERHLPWYGLSRTVPGGALPQGDIKVDFEKALDYL